jgi:hypothetical protein
MDQVQVPVHVRCPDLDDEEVARLTRDLRAEILEVDVDSARPATSGDLPVGAKSGEAIAFGALIVALAPTVLTPLMAVVSSWLSRQPDGVEVEIDGYVFKGPVTEEERAKLVEGLLRRITTTPSGATDEPSAS